MSRSKHKGHHTRFIQDSQSNCTPWHVLIIDDDESTHEVTDIALKQMEFEGRPLFLHHAFSCIQAKEMLKKHPAMALVLLDISLDRDNDGLDLIHWIRRTRKNASIQIAVRTGHCDQFVEKDIVDAYDINDFLSKTDATFQKLQILVRKAIRAFRAQSRLETELVYRKKIEHQLKEKEAQLKELIGHIGDLIWETNAQNQFVDLSGNIQTITGYSKKEVVRQLFDFSMTQGSRTDTWPDIRNSMDKHKTFLNIEISRIHKDGTIKYYFTSGKPVYDQGGEFVGYRGAEKDVTDLVLSEMEKDQLIFQLRHAQRLEAMGTLAGGIAHDFNNILGGILGYAQLLQFEMQNNSTGIAYTEHIVAGCNRAKNLILQILDFSRQRESTSPAKITNPVKIVEETLKLFRASIPSSIIIQTDIDQEVGCIRADPSQIHQAVMNLCTNAGQAIENSMGQITIQVQKVCLDSKNHSRTPALDLDFGEYVTISIQDTGKGIETDTLEKIFNPYFTTKKRGDGTGLGLSVVHGIVTRFNGAITIDTCPGRGTAFTLYFPIYDKSPKESLDKTVSPVHGKASVLFVDDEPMLVDIGKMMLEKLGYKVVATNSPLTGLKTIEEKPDRFDLIITDMTMPDMHGTQLALKIKEINPDIPIILATGFTNIIQAQKANPSGIDAVLPKPITMNSLAQTVHQLLMG